jgi:hypothetical protein
MTEPREDPANDDLYLRRAPPIMGCGEPDEDAEL